MLETGVTAFTLRASRTDKSSLAGLGISCIIIISVVVSEVLEVGV